MKAFYANLNGSVHNRREMEAKKNGALENTERRRKICKQLAFRPEPVSRPSRDPEVAAVRAAM